jgi:hypothetical protein
LGYAAWHGIDRCLVEALGDDAMGTLGGPNGLRMIQQGPAMVRSEASAV